MSPNLVLLLCLRILSDPKKEKEKERKKYQQPLFINLGATTTIHSHCIFTAATNATSRFSKYLIDSLKFLVAEAHKHGGGTMMTVGLHCRLVGRPGRAQGLQEFLDFVKVKKDMAVAVKQSKEENRKQEGKGVGEKETRVLKEMNLLYFFNAFLTSLISCRLNTPLNPLVSCVSLSSTTLQHQ